MNIGVLFHVRLLMESFITMRTRIGAGVRMNHHVGAQGRRTFERFATLFAIERFIRRMNHPMMIQADGVAKSFVAFFARKRTPTGMNTTDVNLKSVRIEKWKREKG